MSWETVKLGEVLTHRKGFITISDTEKYKLCRVQLHRKGVLLREIVGGATIRTKKQQLCKANDFIVAEMDAKVGGYGFIPDELEGAIVSSHYYLFEVNENLLKRDFLAVLNKAQTLQSQIKATGSTNYASVRPSDVLAWEIPLPTIEEQKRIVEKIQTVETNKNQISTELNHQLALVKELRQAYLREAMQGKLIPQDSADEPAEILLEKIKAEKEKLVAEKKIKRDKPLPLIKPEELPFEIPSNWTWCRFSDLKNAQFPLSYGVLVPGNDVNGGVPFVRVQDLDVAHLQNPPSKSISQAIDKQYLRTKLVGGEILICVVGSIGKVALVPDAWIGANIARAVCRFMPSNQISRKFLYYSLNSPSVQDYFKEGYKSIQPTLNVNVLEITPIPLPPLAEQERIVTKLEKLMKLCDELEANIEQGITNADRLLQTALKEALEPK